MITQDQRENAVGRAVAVSFYALLAAEMAGVFSLPVFP